MPGPITWDSLTKKVDDLTTIVEQIAADILTHNQDPSAHGQADEAIYDHRTETDLDHPDESVKNEKILKLARAYKFIVDAGGDGDFTTIQPAIDAANADGGGRIYVKPATYTLDDDLIMYSNIGLFGEDDDTTILDFNNANHSLKIIGTSGNLKRNIKITGFKFTNRAGTTLGALYMDFVEDIDIIRNFFTDNKPSSGVGTYDIYLGAGSDENSRVTIERNRGYDSNRFLWFDSCIQANIVKNVIEAYDSYGFHLNALLGNFMGNYGKNIGSDAVHVVDLISGGQIYANYFTECHSDGMDLGSSEDCMILNNFIEGDKEDSLDGIRLASAYNNIILGNVIKTFGSDAISLSASDDNKINSNHCEQCGGYGLNISNNTCDDNIVVGNTWKWNDTGGLNDQGVGTEAAHNKTV